jgi:Flp pilus assembly protein TadD/TolB-like protein
MKYALIVFFVVLAVLPARAEKIAIAVLDLDAKGEGLSQGVADALTETVRYEFAKQESIDLVAREKMRELAKEKAFQLTGCTDVACAVQIGKALNVKKMVVGSVTKLGGNYTLYLRIVDVEKENVECSDKKDAGSGVNILDQVASSLVRQIAGCMWIEKARETVNLNPNDAEAHRRLAYVLGLRGDYKEAEKEYLEAIRLKPDDAVIRVYYGGLLIVVKKDKEAEKEFREAARLDSNLGPAHNGLGKVLANQGLNEEAQKEFNLAIKLMPDNSFAHENLGYLLCFQGKKGEAVKEFLETVRLDPKNVGAHFNLGNLFYELYRFEEAEREYREVIYLLPNDAEAHSKLGSLLSMQGKYIGAEKELREAIRLNPEHFEAHYELGSILISSSSGNDNIEEAEKEYRIAIRINARDARVLHALAQLLLYKGSYVEAEDKFKLSLQYNESDTISMLNITSLEGLASSLDAQGKRVESRQYWKRALKKEKRPDWIKTIERRLKEPD